MKKYIVKNCPNCWTYDRPKAVCGLTYKTGGFKDESESYGYCENEEKCLLKQIIKSCKNVNCDVLIHTRINNKTTKNRCGAMDGMPLCCEVIAKKDILDLLEIEEVQ